ncbi:MAG TPA: type II toxin-antitoxin system VapC family toxin [Thermoanaerobaculia bacterium]|jgi:predicted nucleic acid-binding protein|nr:type II toxin-antitoxin system VapC family toxin [Thermoanaerobaculia bacterium]
MSVVVDASLLVAATSDAGAEGRWAEDVVRAGSLVAPPLALVEATNILRRFELEGRLGRLEAGAAARDLLLFDLELVPFSPFAERVWELRANVTSYDAWYVAVAEQCDLPLATLDRRLARATGPRCRFLLPPLA